MEAYHIEIIVALMVLGLGDSFAIGAIWARRAALNKGSGLTAKAESEKNTPPPPVAPLTYNDNMDIPAALVGARCKETLERVAPVLGMTPVNLLRAALMQGLTGGRPITEEMLDILEEEAGSTDLPPTSKPGPSDLN